MSMTPGVLVLLGCLCVISTGRLLLLSSSFRCPPFSLARGGHILVATTEVVFEPYSSRKKVLVASRQARAAHDLPLLMQ